MRRESPITLMLNACAWLAFVVPLFIITRTHSEHVEREIANDINPGFISIDCGAITTWYDEDTGITFETDKVFVETGENRLVSNSVDLDLLPFGKLLNTLRIFPKGERNCYVLKPDNSNNNKYLIRATFAYGNYDGNNQNQSFGLYIGVNLWSSITIEADGQNTGFHFEEMIYTLSSTDDTAIHVCLVKTGSTIPFISLLELRPLLNNSIYPNHQITASTTESGPPPLLLYDLRVDVGLPYTGHTYTRLKDDAYDRLWLIDPQYNDRGWYPLKKQIDIEDGGGYKLPAEALKTAAQSLDVLSSLNFDENDVFEDQLDLPYEYYGYVWHAISASL